MSSERAGPNVRDGAPVMAVEVMRACVREGVTGRVEGADVLYAAVSVELASGTAWMKQQRLPYGQLPWFQKVRQISDLNCENAIVSSRCRLGRVVDGADGPWDDERSHEARECRARTGT